MREKLFELNVVKSPVFITGILLLVMGALFIATFKGTILLREAVFMIVLGLFLPYLACLLPNNDHPEKKPYKNIILYGFIALITQLILAQLFYDIFNFTQWLRFYEFFENGINGYTYCFSHKIYDMFPYPPSLLGFLGVGKNLSSLFGGGFFQLFFKLPFIFSNILAGYVIYKLVVFLRGNEKLAEKMFCLYVFNPLLVIVTVVQGEFDPWVVTLTVLAAYFLIVKNKTWLSGLCLGLGIAIKIYPIFLLPFYLIYLRKTTQRVWFTVLAVLPLMLTSLPFLILDYQAFLSISLNFGAKIGPFSLWNINPSLVLPPILTMTPTYIILGFLFLTRFRKHSEDLIMNNLLCMLALYILNPITHENYLIWMLPFVFLTFNEIKHLHFTSFLPAVQMLIFTGIPAYGSGLFYWTYFITGKEVSVPPMISLNSAFWILVNALLVVPFIATCGYVLIKYGFRGTKSNESG